MRTVEKPTRIKLFAPNGRMGKAIAAAVEGDPSFVLSNDECDVILDFSAPDALDGSLAAAISERTPILIGTTGLDETAKERIETASASIAILRAPNTSLGIAILADSVERTARVLGPDWDIEIAEIHHRMKADAPSGTALLLGEAAALGRGRTETAEIGRSGTGLHREPEAIGYASLRGGTVAGDHQVLFLGPDEQVIFSHRAENRGIFARGALVAARFIADKKPGIYSMQDVIRAL